MLKLNGMNDSSVLSWLVSPVDSATFLSEYWEREMLLVHRDNPSYYSDLTSEDEIDYLLSGPYSHCLTAGDYLRLGQEGDLIAPRDYTRTGSSGGTGGDLDLDRIYSLYHEGATIIVQQLNQTSSAVGQLCNKLAKFFGVHSQANAYLTPKSSQGFSAHFDTHNVFVLQIAGSKRWKIYNTPVPLATPETPHSAEHMQSLGDAKELTVSAGDLLYLPRGLVHEARASTETSLHLTVGVHAYTWGDLLRDALDDAIRQDESLRRSVATRLVPASIDFLKLEQEFSSIALQMPKSVNIATTIRSKFKKDLKKWKRSFRGQVAQLERLGDVSAATLVRPRHGCLCEVERDGDAVKVSVYDKTIRFPAFAEQQLRYLLAQEQCLVSQLPPGLDAESQLVLIRRLIAEGIIEEVLDCEPNAARSSETVAAV